MSLENWDKKCTNIEIQCSGDADSVVPVTSTRYSIEAMNLPIVKPWHPWYDHQQVHCYTRPHILIFFFLVCSHDTLADLSPAAN